MSESHGRAIVDQMLARDAFSRWLGVELVALDAQDCTLRMTVREDMVNGFGVGHGGIVFSLADSAMAFACNGDGHVTVAVDNSVSYPAPVRVGDVLTVRAVEQSASARLGFYAATVTNQRGVAVAHFRGTVYRTKRTHQLECQHAPAHAPPTAGSK